MMGDNQTKTKSNPHKIVDFVQKVQEKKLTKYSI